MQFGLATHNLTGLGLDLVEKHGLDRFKARVYLGKRLIVDEAVVAPGGWLYELAARFHAARGFETMAHAYLRNARYCYVRWGAAGKVRQLDEMYPHLWEDERAHDPTSTIGALVEHLDLAIVIKVSQAVSSEVILEKLVNPIMRTALEQAGAERGLLILSRRAEPRIEAEATTSGDTIVVRLGDQPVTPAALPETILHNVLRTQESVILDDAAAQPSFSADPYVR